MLERMAILLIVALSALALYIVGQRILFLKRTKQGLGFNGFERGRPAILYFSAPGCVPCRTIQRPALDLIRQDFGEKVQIFEFDATKNTRLANQWGVLSVPTTFLIDTLGRPRAVNSGARSRDVLIGQLLEIAELPEEEMRHNKYPLSVTE